MFFSARKIDFPLSLSQHICDNNYRQDDEKNVEKNFAYCCESFGNSCEAQYGKNDYEHEARDYPSNHNVFVLGVTDFSCKKF
jgi:hypothetical protein